jgi:hypothetical protein
LIRPRFTTPTVTQMAGVGRDAWARPGVPERLYGVALVLEKTAVKHREIEKKRNHTTSTAVRRFWFSDIAFIGLPIARVLATVGFRKPRHFAF